MTLRFPAIYVSFQQVRLLLLPLPGLPHEPLQVPPANPETRGNEDQKAGQHDDQCKQTQGVVPQTHTQNAFRHESPLTVYQVF
eukprot:CAMPEP_0201284104 /NCGR_PEP_ID=MMETSP1317-20130820/61780_1 /ASSEMBLY_ACC=CAM_ASM_000770 /TAXON_ID=187299 /ORGANISM="Undescribed Undescribed, Strain Undescribed" /LENGTH=82 /DNA_ID=CAMNT_0047602801 /DNA_START=8 /DNA_END=256 /DNA_ORIENTATION=+